MPQAGCIISHCVEFDGQDDYAVSYDGSDSEMRVDRTVATWVRLDNSADATRKQVIYDEGDNEKGLNIYVFDGRLYFGAWNSELEIGTWLSVAINSNQWHHVAFTLAATGEFRVYLDGRLVDSSMLGGPVLVDPGQLTIAASDLDGTRFHDGTSAANQQSGFLAGRLDETRIYNRFLDDREIRGVALFRRIRFSNS